ncbi:hypothetical protein WME88_56075 [Sorangium sp. So ce216]
MSRAVHRPSGTRAVVKLPVADMPSPRALGRLLQEHDVLVKLVIVAQMAKTREL